VERDWKFKMESGKILLTEQELTLIKKSNINLTEVGTSVDNFKEGFVIPLAQIKKAYSIKIQKIYAVIIETRDDHVFSITMANDRSIGKDGSIYLNELINSTTLLAINMKGIASNNYDYKLDQVPIVCSYCGEDFDPGWKFCKKCGKEL